MSKHFDPQEQPKSPDQPHGVDRRTVLRRGAKLAYIVPVVITAMNSKGSVQAQALPTPAPVPVVSPPR
jgi:hypothetical protein